MSISNPNRLMAALIAIVFTVATAQAQAPQLMSFQSVVRDSTGKLVANHSVGLRLSILQGSIAGTAVYTETQTATSNANGLITLQVGGGTVVSGTFSSIDWSAGPYYINSEIDPTGGTNYAITGTTQLLSVAYALYANTAGSANSIITKSTVNIDSNFYPSTVVEQTGTAYFNSPPVGNVQNFTVPAGTIWKIVSLAGNCTNNFGTGEMWLNEGETLSFNGNNSNGGTINFRYLAFQYNKTNINPNIVEQSGTAYFNSPPVGNVQNYTVPSGKIWHIESLYGNCGNNFGSGDMWLNEGETLNFNGNNSNGGTVNFRFFAFEYTK